MGFPSWPPVCVCGFFWGGERSYFWCSWLFRHAKESLGSFSNIISQVTQILKAFCLCCFSLNNFSQNHASHYYYYFKSYKGFLETSRVHTASMVTEKGPVFISMEHSELFSDSFSGFIYSSHQLQKHQYKETHLNLTDSSCELKFMSITTIMRLCNQWQIHRFQPGSSANCTHIYLELHSYSLILSP